MRASVRVPYGGFRCQECVSARQVSMNSNNMSVTGYEQNCNGHLVKSFWNEGLRAIALQKALFSLMSLPLRKSTFHCLDASLTRNLRVGSSRDEQLTK